ncbi:MAG: Crp/Fnr family transcriptional regulator [Cryomorphaceae bacterium]|nr:Crp/Fnr family transcriptional regulator [Cryomorphaceae bacterium]
MTTSEDFLRKLHDFGIQKSFHEGETILRENAYIRSIPIVLHGSVRVMKSDEDGKEMLLYYIRPGESCIMSFLGGIHEDTSKIQAVAEEECELLFIPIEKVNLLMREQPEWLNYIFKLYHKRFEELLEMVHAVTFKKLDERILELLLKKSEVLGTRDLHMTHEQLAQECGSTRVVISRILKKLEDQQFLILSRNKITLV